MRKLILPGLLLGAFTLFAQTAPDPLTAALIGKGYDPDVAAAASNLLSVVAAKEQLVVAQFALLQGQLHADEQKEIADVAALSAGRSVAGAYISPVQLAFPLQQVGVSGREQFVSIINASSTPLVIAGVNFAGPFALSPMGNCPADGLRPLPAGATCTFCVKFSPVQAGPVLGYFTVNSNAPFSPWQVDLSGIGQ